MTEETTPAADEASTPSVPNFSEFNLAYTAPSQLKTAPDGSAALSLFGNVRRDAVQFSGRIKQTIAVREALSALFAVVGSDYRYQPKDRTAYHAYRRMRNASANKGAWQAQHEYFNWLLRNDPDALCILDPVISVQPDQLIFEVFSRDEGCYAALAIDHAAFELDAPPVCGTTNIDFSEALNANIQQLRSYRATSLQINQQQVALEVSGGNSTLEKKIRVPDSWVRGFLQVQSASMLPSDCFQLKPIDLYNCLRHLRLHADVKGKRRGIRVELIPNQPPRLVLEPWETVIPSSAGVYQGTQAKVLRLWGRRRLMLLKRLLPFVESIDVHVSGTGLPSFWVLRCAGMSLTLGLTGFTAADWAQASAFDLLMPRQSAGNQGLEKVVKHLANKWCDDLAGISTACKLQGEALHEALQLGCQHGQLMYDLAQQRYRLRPLTDTPLALDRLEYRSPQHRSAYDLLASKNAVSISKENRVHGIGTEITGKVIVEADKRDYRPQLLISEQGLVSKAECTCNQYRKQGLQQGPCEHLIALRLYYAKREMKRKADGKSRHTISVETRTYTSRDAQGEQTCQLSLDNQHLTYRWGRNNQALRTQRLRFNNVDSARAEYLSRIEKLVQAGYLDASV